MAMLWLSSLLLASATAENATARIRFLDSETGYDLRPERVALAVDNNSPVETTGRSTVELPRGRYALDAALSGYRAFTDSLVVDMSGLQQIHLWLDPLEPAPELHPQRIRALRRANATVINGFVVDDESGKPLSTVRVSCRSASTERTETTLEVEAWTDARGFFQLSAQCASPGDPEQTTATLVFAKTGYVTQANDHVELWPNGDWTCRVRLSPSSSGASTIIDERQLRGGWVPQEKALPLTNDTLATRSAALETAVPLSLGGTNERTDSTAAENGVVRVPRNIRVLRSDGVTIDYVSLETYCRRVLPAEWIASWASYPGGNESLKAGAVAVRTYAIGYVNKPKAGAYDICGTTACQAYGTTTSTYSDVAVSETAGYVMTDENDTIPLGLTEYSAENNSLGLDCGDGFAAPVVGCLADPVCTGESRNGHGRGMCQWGSARWATGLKFPGNSTRDHTTLNGFSRQDWVWILRHYYPQLRLVPGAPLLLGDAVKARTGLNVRGCPDGAITDGIDCPVLATEAVGSAGMIVGGPVQVTTDGAGYTWYQIQWGNATGWSVENYLERIARPRAYAMASEQDITISWLADPGSTYRVQFKSKVADSVWNDLSADIISTTSLGSWSEKRTDQQRFYRVVVIGQH